MLRNGRGGGAQGKFYPYKSVCGGGGGGEREKF